MRALPPDPSQVRRVSGAVNATVPVALGALVLLALLGYFAWQKISALGDQVEQLNGQVATLDQRATAAESRADAAEAEAREAQGRADAAQTRADGAEQEAVAASAEAAAATERAQSASQRAVAAERAAFDSAEERDAAAKAKAEAEEKAAMAQDEAIRAQEEARIARIEAEAIKRQRELELDRLEQALGKIAETKRTSLGVVMNLSSDSIEFDFDKANLRSDDRELLSRIAGVLLTLGDYKIQIFGHTDDVGSAEYNQGLSERRAQAVRDYLVAAGVSADMISTQGMGKSQPLVEGTDPASRQRNRRVELAVTQIDVEYTGVLEGTN